jgi:peptidoglycan/xylan/chitin deacetylase (PgdA/CDA1 family)
VSSVWPNGKRIAILINVMFETWSDGHGPPYSVQTTHLKPGAKDWSAITWGQYGGNVGVWRLLRLLDSHGVKATFHTNARATEVYADAARAIVASGHDISGHGYTQDQLLVDLTPDEQRAAIRKTLDVIERNAGVRPTGWVTPVLAWNEHTAGFLVDEGIVWQGDANYTDLPHLREVNGKRLVSIPFTEFTDNRVLRTNPADYFDVYKNTFDYLYKNEPMAMLALGMHAQFGGRPMMSAVIDQVLAYLTSFPDAAFVTHQQVADWVLDGSMTSPTFAERFLHA